jgi:hypothetical protein
MAGFRPPINRESLSQAFKFAFASRYLIRLFPGFEIRETGGGAFRTLLQNF